MRKFHVQTKKQHDSAFCSFPYFLFYLVKKSPLILYARWEQKHRRRQLALSKKIFMLKQWEHKKNYINVEKKIRICVNINMGIEFQ